MILAVFVNSKLFYNPQMEVVFNGFSIALTGGLIFMLDRFQSVYGNDLLYQLCSSDGICIIST